MSIIDTDSKNLCGQLHIAECKDEGNTLKRLNVPKKKTVVVLKALTLNAWLSPPPQDKVVSTVDIMHVIKCTGISPFLVGRTWKCISISSVLCTGECDIKHTPTVDKEYNSCTKHTTSVSKFPYCCATERVANYLIGSRDTLVNERFKQWKIDYLRTSN